MISKTGFTNDSIWFSGFDWVNSENPAHCVKVDLCWRQTGGNTFTFLDSYLENGLYVTIGLRQTIGGARKASMSVFKHGAPVCVFSQIRSTPGQGFFCGPGGEGDKYCIGDYQFRLGEWYQLIVEAKEERVTGSICQLVDQRATRIATFSAGSGSLIRAKSSNGVALEHFGMNDPCKCESQVSIKRPLRVDIEGFRSPARGGIVHYQECSNSSVARGFSGSIVLSHGGNTTRSAIRHGDFVKWD